MLNKYVIKEIVDLEKITGKKSKKLSKYYDKCYQNLQTPEFSTQYEHEKYYHEAEEVLIAFLRDYAHFNEDNSKLIKQYEQ